MEYVINDGNVEAGTSGSTTLKECLFMDNFYAKKAIKDKTELGVYLTNLKHRGEFSFF